MVWNALDAEGNTDVESQVRQRREQTDSDFLEQVAYEVESSPEVYDRTGEPTLKRGTIGSTLDTWAELGYVGPKSEQEHIKAGEKPDHEKVSTTSLLSVANVYGMEAGHGVDSYPAVFEVEPQNAEEFKPRIYNAGFMGQLLKNGHIDPEDDFQDFYSWEAVAECDKGIQQLSENEHSAENRLQEVQVRNMATEDLTVYVPQAKLGELRPEYQDSFNAVGSIEGRALVHETAMQDEYRQNGVLQYEVPMGEDEVMFDTDTEDWNSDPDTIHVSGLPQINTDTSLMQVN